MDVNIIQEKLTEIFFQRLFVNKCVESFFVWFHILIFDDVCANFIFPYLKRIIRVHNLFGTAVLLLKTLEQNKLNMSRISHLIQCMSDFLTNNKPVQHFKYSPVIVKYSYKKVVHLQSRCLQLLYSFLKCQQKVPLEILMLRLSNQVFKMG